MQRTQLARRTIALVTVLLLSAGIADAQTKIKAGFNLFSPQDDVNVGQQSSVQAERQLPMLNDAQTNAYLNRIGQRLAANAGGPQFQYHFRVVNQSDINAFALPGGFVYVNRGVIDTASNEGELAGVVAHEISHVALRHGTHQASKAYLAQAGISILGGLLGGHVGAGAAQIINTVGGIGLNAVFLKYSRDLETQADIRGAQIMAASGYNPSNMVSFFQKLERVDTSKKTNWMSDHPAPPDRIARIQQEQRVLRVSGNAPQNVAELQGVQGRLRGYGAAPSAGQIARQSAAPSQSRGRAASPTPVTVNVPAPSTQMKTFVNPTRLYSVSIPANWQVYQQGNTGATFAPQGGIGTVNGQSDMVVGAIINHYDPFGNANSLQGSSSGGGYYGNISVQDATNDLIATVQRSSPYLQVVSGSQRQMRVNGGTALSAALRGRDPNTGLDERITVVTRQLSDEHLVYILFITPERDASRYANVLNTMASSLQISNAAH
ncbi:MAG: M48 family metalloprotease [Acidobacteria bacterium]|nr:M48 family metalloprotease [Acidobacteriota bacterium]MBV9071756.1 M48 family metalloprotease [Acidobacteriota bacterium]MBV9187042.1 M48 family metalloprotease [Acidobacteriota bacterium]